MDEGTEFFGELRFRDMLRVDGRLKGSIVSDNMLIVGETGPGRRRDRLRRRLDPRPGDGPGVRPAADRAARRLPGAGTLVSPKLVIEDGAFFQGDCRMGEGARAAGEPAPRRARARRAARAQRDGGESRT